MLAVVITIHIIVAILIVALVLLQQGKGATMGASFGSGSSQTVFGSRGAAPFLFKFTAFLVAVFFVTSISLSYTGKQNAQSALHQTQATSGLSQADYEKQQQEQQAALNQAKEASTEQSGAADHGALLHQLTQPVAKTAESPKQVVNKNKADDEKPTSAAKLDEKAQQ